MTIQSVESLSRIPQWTLADRLRKARESADLEQAELALITGMARGTVSAAENGHRKPSNGNLKLWALATGVPVRWLLTDEQPSGDGLDSVPSDYKAHGSHLRLVAA